MHAPSLNPRRGLLRMGLAVLALPALFQRAFAADKAANPAAPARPDAGKQSLIGTWKMVRATSHDPDGKLLPTPYGPQGMGLVTLSPNSRMMAVLCDGRASLPDGTMRDYASYCGNYTFDGATWRCCTDRRMGRTNPIPIGPQAIRTEIGRPSSSMRFKT